MSNENTSMHATMQDFSQALGMEEKRNLNHSAVELELASQGEP